MLKDERGEWNLDAQKIEELVDSYFQSLFKLGETSGLKLDTPNDCPRLSMEQQNMLKQSFTYAEIKEALSTMIPLKAPSIDGFHASPNKTGKQLAPLYVIRLSNFLNQSFFQQV